MHPKFIPAALIVMIFAAPVRSQVTLTPIDKKYAADDVRDLKVRTIDADITINTSDLSTIAVLVTVEGEDEDKAMDDYEEQNFGIQLESGTLHLYSEREKSYGTSYDWRNPTDIHVEISMPSNIPSNIQTSDGNLIIGELTAGATIRTSDGDIEADWLEGPMISVKTSDGDIRIGTASSEEITIQTSDGDIDADRLEGASVSVKTSDGDLVLGDVTGDFRIQTSDGDIMIDSVDGKLDARTSDGDLLIGEIVSSGSKARTSDGEIKIEKVTGYVTVSTSDGDVELGLIDPDDVNVTISSGDAFLRMPRGLSATLDIKAQDVSMRSFSNFSGDREDSRIRGDLNGGGALIRVRTSDGDVALRPMEH